ncbi:MAG: hypothetical protein J5496_07815 [Lachnospiraceae bacterium]|nr:hypothetical protein [Lachnospiraceae bacterium]
MSLLSKLFGESNKKAENAAVDFLKSVAKKLESSANSPKPETAPAAKPAPAAPAAEPERSDALWGEIMPKDENQFSFNGSYREYFEGIFRSEFADLSFELSHPQYYKSDIYTFRQAGNPVLVIELMGKSCAANKLRRDTLRSGLKYLRFYTDCSDIGWWNARTYVIGRMKEALGR